MARTQAELGRLLIQGRACIVPTADLKRMREKLTGVYLSLGEHVETRDERSREVLDAQIASIAYLLRTCNELLDAGLAEAIRHEDSELPY